MSQQDEDMHKSVHMHVCECADVCATVRVCSATQLRLVKLVGLIISEL